MIYIVDRFVEGYLHVLANVNTIKILNSIYPDINKKFIAENEHSDLVQGYFNENNGISNIVFEPFKNKQFSNVNKIKQVFRVVNRLFQDIYFFYTLFRSINKDKTSLLFVTHIYPLSLVFIKILKLFFPKVKMIVTIHGEVEYLFYGKTKYEKIIGRLYDFVFKIKSSNFYYLFLTKVSRSILIKNRKLKEDEIMAIILPTLPDNDVHVNTINVTFLPVKIGHIGSAGKRKNTELLYNLGNCFHNEIQQGKVIFSVIGPIEDTIKPYLNNNVIDFVNGQSGIHLDRRIFNFEARAIDYAIFFYGKNDFVLRSSAAFFDAIYFEKPLIVLKNDFFEEIFEEAGNIGYLCTDYKEMNLIIQKIISDNSVTKELYFNQLENIKKYKETLNLSFIATDLAAQISSLKLLIK